MLSEENFDKIRNTIAACDAHNARMQTALKKLSVLFPLTEISFFDLSEDQVSYTDQLILRFLKLQDLIGKKLCLQTLLILQEDYTDRPILDILNRLEQLKIIDSVDSWIALREVRNLITHDYPHLVGELIEGLNQLSLKAVELSDLYLKIRDYAVKRI